MRLFIWIGTGVRLPSAPFLRSPALAGLVSRAPARPDSGFYGRLRALIRILRAPALAGLSFTGTFAPACFTLACARWTEFYGRWFHGRLRALIRISRAPALAGLVLRALVPRSPALAVWVSRSLVLRAPSCPDSDFTGACARWTSFTLACAR